jgi:Predicted membrane protein/domain
MYQSSNYIFAPVWKRFTAFFVDIVILTLFVLLSYNIVKVLAFFVGILSWSEFVARYWYYFTLGLTIVIGFIYFTLLPTTDLYATIGQAICRLRQLDVNGNKLTYKKSVFKLFMSYVSKFLYLGYLYVFSSEHKQTFHDKVAKVYLIER